MPVFDRIQISTIFRPTVVLLRPDMIAGPRLPVVSSGGPPTADPVIPLPGVIQPNPVLYQGMLISGHSFIWCSAAQLGSVS